MVSRPQFSPHFVIPFALLAVALCALQQHEANACSVPVFRYALERWPADPYEAYLFHRGPLSESEQALLEGIEELDEFGLPLANLAVTTVDLDGEPEEDAKDFWSRQEGKKAPWLVVFYPRAARIPGVAVEGTFSEDLLNSIVESQAREELVKRLVAGETGVWVFLESGNADKDDLAYATLTKELVTLEPTLQLPDIKQQDIDEGYLSIEPSRLQVAFSALRLSRDDPEEQPLVNMLLGTEPDLRDTEEPLAFPVFGRGRVLYALVGEGINRINIEDACRELLGPCTCQVKDQNPGTDLLIKTSWDSLIELDGDDVATPPLPGLAILADSAATTASEAIVEEKSNEVPQQSDESSDDAATAFDDLAADQFGAEESPVVVHDEYVGWTLIPTVLSLGAVGVVIAIASVVLLRRPG